jgi:fido (protein-threonine AMPylation protein)
MWREQGIGVDALHAALPAPPSRRTLQRRLAGLVRERRVVTHGEGRALRYRLPPIHGTASITFGELRAEEAGEPYVPTSPEGEEIKSYVRRAMQQRRPVAYDVPFLEAYAPNQTCYLPAALRNQLHAIGRSSVQAQAPAGTFARDILNRLLIDLSWASSQLEGNTYTRLDTERLIEFGQVAEGKDAFETQMILNHKAAIEYLVGDTRVAVDIETILALHALLSDGLLRDAMAGGRVRRRAVEIGGSVFRPIALPQRLDELFGIVMRMAAEVADPFEQAFFLMVHLPYLQPFEDVNKRVSRLAANIPLMHHNLSPLSFIDLTAQAYVDGMLGVYELGTRCGDQGHRAAGPDAQRRGDPACHARDSWSAGPCTLRAAVAGRVRHAARRQRHTLRPAACGAGCLAGAGVGRRGLVQCFTLIAT